MKAVVTAVPNSQGVKQSTSDGRSFGYVGNELKEDSDVALTALYDYITLGISGFQKAAGGAATTEEIASIPEDASFTFYIRGGTRTRLYTAAPENKAGIAGSGVQNAFQVTCTFTEAGGQSPVFSVSSTNLTDNKLYYSIAGALTAGGDDMNGSSALSIWEAGTRQTDAGASFTQALELSANAFN